MNDKLTKIMDICNKWTQYHRSLRENINYDDVTKTIVKPIINIIQNSTPTARCLICDKTLGVTEHHFYWKDGPYCENCVPLRSSASTAREKDEL